VSDPREMMIRLAGVVDWDEYGQGYNKDGQLVLCICGEIRAYADWSDHYCPYDEQEEEDIM